MKSRTLGVYVGLAVDPDVDWLDICNKTKAAGYDTISVFLTTCFFNKGLWPWPYVNGKFDFSLINPDYREHFRKACMAAKATGIKLHLCMVDQFHGFGDNPGPDPFRQAFGLPVKAPDNTVQRTLLESMAYHAGLKLAGAAHASGWDEEALYSSWDGTKCTWLWWDPHKDPKYMATPAATLAQYKPLGQFGNGMQRFMQMLANVAHQTGVSFSFKWGNETYGRIDSNGHKSSRGDRDECVIWCRSIFRLAGLQPDLYFDFLAYKAPGFTVDYDTMRKAFDKGIRQKHHAKLEVHHVFSVADAQKFGFDPVEDGFVKYSTDADMHMIANYMELGHATVLPDVDLKMDQIHVTAKNVTDFFNGLIKKYDAYV